MGVCTGTAIHCPRNNRNGKSPADRGRYAYHISRDNFILVLSCSFMVSKDVFECWPRWNFLWALANMFFYDITIKLYYCQKRWCFKFNFRKNNLHQQKARKKLNIRHLNGHLDFSSGFQVIDPSGYENITNFLLMQVIFSKIELEISPFLTVIQFYNNIVEKRVGKSPQEISTQPTFIYLVTLKEQDKI